MVVFAAYVEGPAPTGTEHLYAASKLGGEVELGCLEHISVEIKKPTSGSEERLDVAVVYPIHLRTDRTATFTIGIVTSVGIPWVSHNCQGDKVEHPTYRKRPTCINQPGVATFYLVQAPVNGIRKGVLVGKLATEPRRVLIQRRSFLCACATDKEEYDSQRTRQMRKEESDEPAMGSTARMRFNRSVHALVKSM